MCRSIHVIGSKISGGAERFYARLINSLAETTQITAVNPPNSPSSRLVNPNIEQIHPRLRGNYDLRTILNIRQFALAHSPAIVQTYMGRATRLTRIPRDKGLVHIARLGGYYNLKAYRHAHHLIGNTKGICDYLIKEGVSAEQVHYIGNFVEPVPAPDAEEQKKLRLSLKIPENACIIACAARFIPKKGLQDLVCAFAKLKKNNPDCRLILVGDGPAADSVRKQIRALNLENDVILPGWQDPAPYYHLADVLTSPSRHEPLGNTILEAWACRKPLVATATLGATELITPDQNGLITPVENPEALAEALEQLIQHPEQRTALANDGLKTVTNRFSKETITSQYLELYRELIKKPI